MPKDKHSSKKKSSSSASRSSSSSSRSSSSSSSRSTSFENSREITFITHGWNDNLTRWKSHTAILETTLKHACHFFAYESRDDSLTIADAADDFHAFMWQKISGLAVSTDISKANFENLTVNILCYSTGSLILRKLFVKYYTAFYKKVVKRVVFLAPANGGSPFAKKGNTGIGKYWVGEKKNFNHIFSHGHNILTALECCSPFIWELTKDDLFNEEANQYFHPDRILTTVVQGTSCYPPGLMSKITRGDQTGTDGTVCVSGASMDAKRVSFVEKEKTAVAVQSSSTSVALKLIANSNHSFVNKIGDPKSQVFRCIIKGLTCTRKIWESKKIQWEASNEFILTTPSLSIAKLLVFHVNIAVGKAVMKPNETIVFSAYYHALSTKIAFGDRLDDVNKLTAVRNNSLIQHAMGRARYHTQSLKHVYYLVNPEIVISAIETLRKDKLNKSNKHIVVTCSIQGVANTTRALLSSTWFRKLENGSYNPSLIFGKDLPILQSLQIDFDSKTPCQETLKSLLYTNAHPDGGAVLAQIKKEQHLSDALYYLSTRELRKLFLLEKHQDDVLKFICKNKIEELSASARATIISSIYHIWLQPTTLTTIKHDTSNFLCSLGIEAIAYLLVNSDASQLQTIKWRLPSHNVNLHKIIFFYLPLVTRDQLKMFSAFSSTFTLEECVLAHFKTTCSEQFDLSVSALPRSRITDSFLDSNKDTKVVLISSPFMHERLHDKTPALRLVAKALSPLLDCLTYASHPNLVMLEAVPQPGTGVVEDDNEVFTASEVQIVKQLAKYDISYADILIGCKYSDTQKQLSTEQIGDKMLERLVEFVTIYSEYRYIFVGYQSELCSYLFNKFNSTLPDDLDFTAVSSISTSKVASDRKRVHSELSPHSTVHMNNTALFQTVLDLLIILYDREFLSFSNIQQISLHITNELLHKEALQRVPDNQNALTAKDLNSQHNYSMKTLQVLTAALKRVSSFCKEQKAPLDIQQSILNQIERIQSAIVSTSLTPEGIEFLSHAVLHHLLHHETHDDKALSNEDCKNSPFNGITSVDDLDTVLQEHPSVRQLLHLLFVHHSE